MAEQTEDSPWFTALLILGVVVGAVLAGWILYKLIGVIAIAVGTAVGIAGGTIVTTVSPWVAPVTAAGLGLTGGALAIRLLVVTGREAGKDPYDWTVALLGILAAFSIDIAKEYAINSVPVRLVMDMVIAFLVVVAGALYKRGGVLWRSIAVILILAPPLGILAQNLTRAGLSQILSEFGKVAVGTWLKLGVYVLLGGSLAVVNNLTTHKRALQN